MGGQGKSNVRQTGDAQVTDQYNTVNKHGSSAPQLELGTAPSGARDHLQCVNLLMLLKPVWVHIPAQVCTH